MATIKTVHGRTAHGTARLHLAELGLRPGGLLEAAVNDAPTPLHAPVAFQFNKVVAAASLDLRARQTLNKAPSRVSHQDIQHLFRLFDAVVEDNGWKIPRVAADGARRVLRYCTRPLATGDTVRDVRYRSRLTGTADSERSTLSDHEDATFSDEFLRQPLAVALAEVDPVEHVAKSVQHLRSRLNRVTDACREVLDAHTHLAARIADLKTADWPPVIGVAVRRSLQRGGYTTGRALQKLPPEARFFIAAYITRRDASHKELTARFKATKTLGEQPTIDPIVVPDTSWERRALILSDYYIPQYAVFACLMVVLIATTWNAHTALALSKSDVNFSQGGHVVTIASVKGRTDEAQSVELTEARLETQEPDSFSFDDELTIHALRLLVENRNNIDLYGTSDGDSLFVALSTGTNGRPHFKIPDFTMLLREFRSRTRIPLFHLDHLRTHAANLRHLLNGRDIFATQAALNHKSPETTSGYLHSALNRALEEANIIKYMKLLGNCLLYATGRSNVLTPGQKNGVEANNLLLFPPSTLDENSRCAADNWIQSGKLSKLVVTEADVQHCALQRRMYREDMYILMEANSERFLRVHLPRIVFCEAMYRLCSQSKARSLLAAYERELA